MKLCNACIACIEGSATRIKEPSQGRGSYVHHQLPREFLKAIQDNCVLCCAIWHEIEAETGGSNQVLGAPGTQASEEGQDTRAATECIVFALNRNKTQQRIRFDVPRTHRVRKPKDGISRFESIRVGFVPSDQVAVTKARATESSHVNDSPDDMSVKESTGSARTLEQAACWLSECDGHAGCEKTESRTAWHPPRLIDVVHPQSSHAVRLVETTGETILSPYASLSHCWGKADFLQMRSTNIESLKNGIDLESLPSTFQDAIMVCRQLSVRFLWIDSLCILQDSKEDWAMHAGLMSSIYANGRFNIAADDIRTSQETMFRPLGPLSSTPFCLEVTRAGPMDRGIQPGSYYVIDAALWSTNILDSPLNGRTWVLQERMLSQRLLHFTRDQVLWQCRSMLASQSYMHGLPWTAMSSSDLKLLRLDQFSSAVNGHNGGRCIFTEGCKVCEYWAELITTYTSCLLTFPDDRPVAIAGLASTIGSLMDDQYIAGMWKRHLRRQLYWQARYNPSSPRLSDDTRMNPIKPSNRKFPSFSWLSLDTRIGFGQAVWPNSAVKHLYDIVDVDVQEASPRLDFQYGRLELRGVLIPVAIRPYDFRDRIPSWNVSCLAEPDYLTGALINPDFTRRDLPTSSEGLQHFLMPLSAIQTHGRVAALVLELVDEERCEYRRIGAGAFDRLVPKNVELYGRIESTYMDGTCGTFFLI